MQRSHTQQDQLIDLINEEFDKEFFEGLTRIAYELHINGETLINRFTHEYIKYIYENVSSKKAHIMAHTGFKRNVVEKFLRTVKQEPNTQKTRSNALFKEFFQKLQIECLKSPDHTISKYGPYSFKSIFNQCLINDKTYTAPSVLEALINAGKLIDLGDRVHFIRSIKSKNDKKNINRFLSNTFNRYVSTALQNHHSDKESGELFDQFINTPAISNKKSEIAINKIREILRATHKKLWEELETHEGEDLDDCDYIHGVHMYISKQAKSREKS